MAKRAKVQLEESLEGELDSELTLIVGDSPTVPVGEAEGGSVGETVGDSVSMSSSISVSLKTEGASDSSTTSSASKGSNVAGAIGEILGCSSLGEADGD